MEFKEKTITKLCSFYVSDWHLVTMLLPYINRKINEQEKIAVILEKDIKQNITTLVEKLNLKNKERILSINWNKKQEIKKQLNSLKENEKIVIFINGSEEFIKKQNRKIEIYFQKHLIKNNIKVINCYDIAQYSGSIEEILDEHDKVLNTSGEREITEIFEDYKKQEKKEVV